MTYELAQELKEAGFPQLGDPETYISQPESQDAYHPRDTAEKVYCPSLSMC